MRAIRLRTKGLFLRNKTQTILNLSDLNMYVFIRAYCKLLIKF